MWTVSERPMDGEDLRARCLEEPGAVEVYDWSAEEVS